MLGAEQLAAHLLSRRLLTTEAVVVRGVMFIDRSRRNRNFEIAVSGGASYFAKQSHDIDALGREAEAYEFCHRRGGAGLRRYMPRLHDYDRRSHVLVVQKIGRALSIADVLQSRKRLGLRTAVELGKAVAAIHECEPGQWKDAGSSPWILSITAPSLEWLRRASAANVRLVRIVQASRTLTSTFDSLKSSWRPSAFIHNDLRLANCLVSTDRQHRPRIRIIDWELAGAGEPSWDVGCVFADLLTLWILSMQFRLNPTADRLARSATLPLSRVRPLIAAFWSSYAGARTLTSSQRSELLPSIGRFAAARLVQHAYELMDKSSSLTASVVTLLQLSINVAERPGDAASALFGIRLRHG